MGLFERFVRWYESLIWGAASKGLELDLSTAIFLSACGREPDSGEALSQLIGLLPEDSNICLESGRVVDEVARFFEERAVANPPLLKPCMLGPRPSMHHLAATADNLLCLAAFTERYDMSEIVFHVYAYRDQTVIMNWHDFPDTDCLALSPELPADSVRRFAEALGCTPEF